MKRTILVLSILTFSSTIYAAACPSNQTIFHCQALKTRVIDICKSGNDVLLTYGKPNQRPDFSLKTPMQNTNLMQDGNMYDLHAQIGNQGYTLEYRDAPTSLMQQEQHYFR
jgi:hypothetical protein